MFALVFLVLVLIAFLLALALETADRTAIPAHDPVHESIMLARSYVLVTCAPMLPIKQGARKQAFKRAQSIGLGSDALLYLDALWMGATTWRDERGLVHGVDDRAPAPVPAPRKRIEIVPTVVSTRPLVYLYRLATIVLIGLAGVSCLTGGAPSIEDAAREHDLDCISDPVAHCTRAYLHSCDGTDPCVCVDDTCYCD